ncbi:uncharacterized protein LOC136771914 [Amia ocellicauda]|uniref:uncharacterized protein LOC136771914 n=1 Tax=Amia ocellicauda TaxID=2972642 RepID=UPI00346499AD
MSQHSISLACLLLASLTLSSVAREIRNLETLQDLNETSFGRSFPRHGLRLLHWFTHHAISLDVNSDTDHGGDGSMTMLFDPRMRLFGFHLYDDRYGRLPALNSSLSYHVVGDLDTQNHPGARALPWWVKQDYLYVRSHHLSAAEHREANCERLLVTFNSDSWAVGAVYLVDVSFLTGAYLVSANLLRDIHSCSFEEFSSSLVIDHRHCETKREDNKECSELFSSGTTLEVKTNSNGQARMVWAHLPWANGELWVGLFEDDSRSDTSALAWHQVDRVRGDKPTKVDVNPGLQVRLLKEKTHILLSGEELDEACGEIPRKIPGFRAYLQLHVQNGLACARMYIHRSFTNWREKLNEAWVGFYSKELDHAKKFRNFQWVTKFEEDMDLEAYLVLEDKCWGGRMSWGVQARFYLGKGYGELVRTTPWKC